MIRTKKELKKYIAIDCIMNFGDYSLKQRFIRLITLDAISRYLKTLRKMEYYSNKNSIFGLFLKIKLKRLSLKTGISIPPNVFGYGLVIPHHGTIVVGKGNVIGNYCVLHTSTCITAGNKQIGDFFYLCTGAKVVKDIIVAKGVTVSANSVLNKNADCPESLYAGAPAKFIKHRQIWPIKDGTKYTQRYKLCEKIVHECRR